MSIPAFMESVEWTETDSKPADDGLPYATHSGVMDLFGHKLRCFRLNDGRAIFDADDLNAFMADWLGKEAQ